ncbi:hypothetical protein ACFX11_026689 [Malus domestica]
MMEKAIRADKKNPLPMYHKASILMSLEKFDEALAVLEEVKEYSPRESSVYALMGKIYKRRNMHEKAMLHFSYALDLKPSSTDVATIKADIEKLTRRLVDPSCRKSVKENIVQVIWLNRLCPE